MTHTYTIPPLEDFDNRMVQALLQIDRFQGVKLEVSVQFVVGGVTIGSSADYPVWLIASQYERLARWLLEEALIDRAIESGEAIDTLDGFVISVELIGDCFEWWRGR